MVRPSEREVIMTKLEFASAVAGLVGGTVQQITKANGVVKTGIVSRNADEIRIHTTAYIDEYFDSGYSVQDTANEIRMILAKGDAKATFEINFDFENVLNNIYFRVLRKDWNDSIDLFFDMENSDLILVPYIRIYDSIDEKSVGSCIVTNALYRSWNISRDKLYNIAISNTRCDGPTVRSITDILGLPFDDNFPMYVVTNSKRLYGAVNAFTNPDLIEEKLGDRYVLIPSSIHEMIAIPEEIADKGILVNMISEVNQEKVSETERLSDHPYKPIYL